MGIPEEDQAQLFEAFHRARNVEHISGTGLGLAIVKQAVELQTAAVSVSSKVGKGTEVHCHVAGFGGERRNAVKKILVVEDSHSLRKDILEMLGFEGFDAVGAENGVVGVERARQYAA